MFLLRFFLTNVDTSCIFPSVGGAAPSVHGDSFASAIGGKGNPMENTQEINAPKVKLSEARLIAKKLSTLPVTFGDTLVVHMKARKLTSEAMAEALGVCPRTISMLRNSVAPSLSLRQVTAICILLQLPPELSDDMIAKAGIRPLPIAEHIAYKMLLRMMYSADLQTCNDLLRAEKFEPLTKEKIY